MSTGTADDSPSTSFAAEAKSNFGAAAKNDPQKYDNHELIRNRLLKLIGKLNEYLLGIYIKV